MIHRKNIMSLTLLAAVATIMLGFHSCGGNSNTTDPQTKPDTVVTADKSKVVGYITSANRSNLMRRKEIDFSTTDQSMSPFLINIDESTTYQTVDGFGAALTGSTCYNLLKMNETNRAAFLKQTFDTNSGYGFSMARISIGSSDFGLDEYSCCDTQGIEFFDLNTYDKRDVIPVLKEVLAINPNLKIVGSPWSCPRWMKIGVNNTLPYSSWTSGRLNPKYYADYAEYFVRWIQSMQEEGIPIYAITVQNEPLNHGNSMSLYMPWQTQQEFVRDYLGPAFKTAGITTKILAFDHNYNYDGISEQTDYPMKIFADADAAKYFDGSAWHNYGGNVSELDDARAKYPDKSIYFTEASIGTWNYSFDSCLINDFGSIFLGTLSRWCKGVTLWNLMLDENRGPNRPGGCTTCFGAVDIRTDYSTISYNTHYYQLAHAASAVATGAVRIGYSGYQPDGVEYQFFKNPDGSFGMLLLNSSSQTKTMTISDGTKAFTIEVPTKSIASYRWNSKENN